MDTYEVYFYSAGHELLSKEVRATDFDAALFFAMADFRDTYGSSVKIDSINVVKEAQG